MPETDVIPTSASVASTGLGIRYIGDHCYAYAGTQAVSNESKLVLSFVTGSGYIVANVAMSTDITLVGTGEDFGFQIQLNDIEIVDHEYNPSNYGREPDQVKLILPPFTDFKGYLSTTDVNDILMGMTFTGRVYGEK